MVIDSRTVKRGKVLKTDLCIIGGGPTGISIAREFKGSDVAVTLLESGGLENDKRTQQLYSGQVSGPCLEPGDEKDYLTATRNRYFGGSSNTWRGFCRALDPIDFPSRDWMPESGWPLPFEQLAAYNQRTSEVLQIPLAADVIPTKETEQQPFLFEPDSPIETAFFQVNRLKFGRAYLDDFKQSANLKLLLNANVTQIVVNQEGSKVEALEVSCLDGNRFRIKAKVFVLATGGIENARLLLASNKVVGDGVGNQKGLVGRYYMDHPNMLAGAIIVPHPRGPVRIYSLMKKAKVRACLRIRTEQQRSHQLQNSVLMLRKMLVKAEPDLLGQMSWLSQRMSAQETTDRMPKGAFNMVLEWTGEQAPNPDSRVSLADDVDELGMPRVRVAWQLGESDALNMQRSAEMLAHELGLRLRGRAQLRMSPERPWPATRSSCHHMGTTRMDPSAAKGVVNTDCRLHGVGNLYVGGSSVFPTVGSSNPMFSTITLALRLADHLKGVLKS